MLTQKFFTLFPPPKFLNIPHAGLDISDEAVRCIEFGKNSRGLFIHRFGEKPLAPGVIESGVIKDPKTLSDTIAVLAKELKISVVKASLPEERLYLFKTEVPSTDEDEIRQNIEFKLEENVPLSPAEAIFFFDLIPDVISQGKILTSVSVAPYELVSSYLNAVKAAGLTVLSFEVQAKAIARSLVPRDSNDTQMILDVGARKTGIYIVCGGVVCFTSTVSWGGNMLGDIKDPVEAIAGLKKEVGKVYTYWTEHGGGTNINRIILSGKTSITDGLASHVSPDARVPVEIGRVWQNVFSTDSYIPPVPFEDSLDYAIATGLAL